ncbi:MAG: hypothetical protein JNJ75_06490 [Cyclobacteriaceae bacterium]|nr:hypothetical protein [Cyclobacteriaceae bacterium]
MPNIKTHSAPTAETFLSFFWRASFRPVLMPAGPQGFNPDAEGRKDFNPDAEGRQEAGLSAASPRFAAGFPLQSLTRLKISIKVTWLQVALIVSESTNH